MLAIDFKAIIHKKFYFILVKIKDDVLLLPGLYVT